MDYANGAEARPDFGLLCYPVISLRPPYGHLGSGKNLLGDSPDENLLTRLCLETRVHPSTPPCFLWHTAEDRGVLPDNSFAFCSALGAHSVPYELHVYEKGGHGLGLKTDYPWPDDFIRWMKNRGLL
ncbi:MAG: prolyl oligopeptidase family serine peptidase [Planctomycetes bacterium]|nr:prolyl oligopeptidase family serine peptidase [Planctomycetota bacterium]